MNFWEKILLLWSFWKSASSHISLQYPPARRYDLDFLDSFRTSGECGMNQLDLITVLEAGSKLNVTWSLGYAHGGGYRIELISGGGEMTTLVPQGGGKKDFEQSTKYTQFHEVILPGKPCTKCFIRLIRQALEWGKNFQFRSCSDVTLVAGPANVDPCTPHGRSSNGGCVCDRLYSGDRCQYKSMCTTDNDCNGPKGQGRCELINNALFADKMCFCNQGWFGPQCEKRNEFQAGERSWNKTEFTQVSLDGPSLQWRLAGAGQVELITEFPTTSWVGVGWRPADADRTCQQFPADAAAPIGTDWKDMDCADMVIGMAREGRGAVGDYYTRDRSTPRVDSFWGGEDDLTSGSVWQKDGKTVLRFRRRITGGAADHPLQGKLNFIWAMGQNDDFYQPNQLKYHGSRDVSRGSIVLVLPAETLDAYHPVIVGIIISGSFLALLAVVQLVQNLKPVFTASSLK